MIEIELIKRLREETDAGVMETKKALEEAGGNYEAAKKALQTLALEKAAKKSERETGAGRVAAYVHHTGRLASLVSLACETDFVSRTEEFKTLANEIALQAASMKPHSVDELLEQEYIRDPSLKIKELLIALAAKVGENIVVKDFKVLEV